MEIEHLWSYHMQFLFCYIFFFIILACVMNCSVSFVILWYLSNLASAYSLEVVHLSTLWTALAIFWEISWLMCLPLVFKINMSFTSSFLALHCSFALVFMQRWILYIFDASISTFWTLGPQIFWPMPVPDPWWLHLSFWSLLILI